MEISAYYKMFSSDLEVIKQNNENTHCSTGKEANEKKKMHNPMQILEDALVICEFGRFHIFLMLATLLAVIATTSVSTTTSFVLPIAECDLKMNMMEKGLLNAIPFLGQVFACFFTGFISDAFGRRICLFGGSLCIFLSAVFGASSQNYSMLVFGKLMEGIFMSLVFTATATMVTEFTPRHVRDRALLAYSAFMPISIAICTLLAWGILPRPWHVVINEHYFEIHSWNIYLYASATWSLLAAIFYGILPESPKFLLTHGQENEALEVVKTIFTINTGNDKKDFPIKSLNVSGVFIPTVKTTVKKQFANAIYEMKELFRRPLLHRLILFSTITTSCLLVSTALRLWYPQLSTIIENYEQHNNNRTDQFCQMIDEHLSQKKIEEHYALDGGNMTENIVCVPQLSGSKTYTNGILLGLVSLLLITITGYFVAYTGQKPLMSLFFVLCSICSSALYWTNSSIQIAILVSATFGFLQATFSLQQNILVRVFPTTVRSTAISLVLVAGRTGSLLGNVLFPIFLELGCMVPFITLTTITLCVAGLVYFLPNPRKENKTGDK